MIERSRDKLRIEEATRRSPVVVVVGARQVGKSTLTRLIADGIKNTLFDLQNPRHAAQLAEPMLALESLTGLVVIDEAQLARDLFPVIRVLADRPDRPATFLLLGSASPELVGLSAESLAGRVELLELGGLRVADVGGDRLNQLWLQGALPRSFELAERQSNIWRDNYIATFLERDLAQLGFRMPATQMRRFWTMLAHYSGQTWNGAELARAMGVAQTTVRRYLDALTDALVVRQVQPWFANTSKRLVRSPKIYVRDTGVLHRLLSIDSMATLLNHPKVGASWEGLVIEQIALDSDSPIYFWGTQSGAELDLFTVRDGRNIGIEIKRTDTPRVTPSMRSALTDLGLDVLLVAHPGQDRFRLSERTWAVPAVELLTDGLDTIITNLP